MWNIYSVDMLFYITYSQIQGIPINNKSFQWGSTIRPGPRCLELDQFGEDCIFIVRDPSCTRKEWRHSFQRMKHHEMQLNPILGSIIYQNWANSGPMLPWIWCRFPPSHNTFHYLYRDGIMVIIQTNADKDRTCCMALPRSMELDILIKYS